MYQEKNDMPTQTREGQPAADRELEEQQQCESELVRSVQNAARDVAEATQRLHDAVIDARSYDMPLRAIGHHARLSHQTVANICKGNSVQ